MQVCERCFDGSLLLQTLELRYRLVTRAYDVHVFHAVPVSAHALNDVQIDRLKTQLRGRAGRDVAIEARVDPNILGGIVVKLGSQMIDASLRTKLNRLAQAMKG